MKNNNLNHFKFFSADCDIFIRQSACPTTQAGDILFTEVILALGCLFKALIPPHPRLWRGPGEVSMERYTYKQTIMQNLKSTEPRIKSTENTFSADNKSTMNFLKTSETRYQPTSLFKNSKKINIDQL